MVSATDQGAIEGAMDSASDESVNKSRSNGCYKRWIVEHLKERWMAQALDQGEIEGPLDSASDGSVSKSRRPLNFKTPT